MLWFTKSLSANSSVIVDALSISKQVANSPTVYQAAAKHLYFFATISFNPCNILVIWVLHYVHLLDEETEIRKVKEHADVFTNQRAFI